MRSSPRDELMILYISSQSQVFEQHRRPCHSPSSAAVTVVMNPCITPSAWGSESSSSGEDERRRRRRKIVSCAITSALAEASASPDAPMRGGPRPIRAPNRDRALCEGAVDLDKDYFNGLDLVSAPRLELDLERRYRMPRVLYERVRAGVLEVDPYCEQKPNAAGVMGTSADQKITAAMRPTPPFLDSGRWPCPVVARCTGVNLSPSMVMVVMVADGGAAEAAAEAAAKDPTVVTKTWRGVENKMEGC
jgi:hypothetical protein